MEISSNLSFTIVFHPFITCIPFTPRFSHSLDLVGARFSLSGCILAGFSLHLAFCQTQCLRVCLLLCVLVSLCNCVNLMAVRTQMLPWLKLRVPKTSIIKQGSSLEVCKCENLCTCCYCKCVGVCVSDIIFPDQSIKVMLPPRRMK